MVDNISGSHCTENGSGLRVQEEEKSREENGMKDFEARASIGRDQRSDVQTLLQQRE
jgi:hypothetical protein